MAGARDLTRAYREILGRRPDKGGLDHYQKQIREGRSIGDIRKEMANSPEYRKIYGEPGMAYPGGSKDFDESTGKYRSGRDRGIGKDRAGAGFPYMPEITLPAFGPDGKPMSRSKRMSPRPPGRGGSYASGPGLDRPGTGSTLVDQGLMSLTELGNKYSDNEMIGGLVTGTYADIARTQANTGLAIQYNDAMYESMGRYQGNLENLRTANTGKLMAQEGAITGGLMDKQGKLQQEGLRVAGDEQRKGIRETGSEQRLTLGEQGRQDRMGVRERTQAQKNLRADARGAIRRSGARFFG